MDNPALIHGLLLFVAFIAFVALHEFAHAWVAGLCGDDTPRLQGRVTLDPIAHIDPIGTILLPLIIVVMSAAGGNAMMIGWGKPVEVNRNNFRHKRRDDILVSVAGPVMNLLIAIVILLIAKIVEWSGGGAHLESLWSLARFSLLLCFFNLLPIPPLDGGHIMRNIIGMSDEAYYAMCRYSFLFIILVMRVEAVGIFINTVTDTALVMLALPFGWRLTFS